MNYFDQTWISYTEDLADHRNEATIPTEIKGKYSGATGFLRSAVSNSTSLVIYNKTGEFITNEPFEINAVNNNRVATAITSFGMQDVKSLYGGPVNGDVGFAKTFNGD